MVGSTFISSYINTATPANALLSLSNTSYNPIGANTVMLL